MFLTYLKILTYTFEFHFVRIWAFVFNYPIHSLPKYNDQQKLVLNNAVKKLLKDWKEISHYSFSFDDLDFSRHFSSFILVLEDLKVFLVRKALKDSHDISSELVPNDCPDYFKRNYHYQTDGYFSEKSALIYDHQIELLFMGTCHLMRKVSYSLLNIKRESKFSCLEIGAGSGTSARQFLNIYPLACVDLLDASEGYLSAAKKLYGDLFNDYICSFIESFETTKRYDVIYICFTMHEIPVEVWPNVLEKLKLLLSESGRLLVIDAMQDNDRQDVQFALDDFEQDYYEPYFEKYRKTQLETYIENCGFSLEARNDVLFSKALVFKKS